MAIRPYLRQEQVSGSAPRVDFSGGEIADPGQVFRQASRSLLATAEPILEKRASDRGKAAGARAPMIRDENNILRRSPLPKEGGLVYGEAYARAMNTIYKGRLLFDAEVAFEDIRKRNIDNPQQALVEMQAHAEAVAETIPDDVRAEIEPDLFREAIQRFNGLNVAKIERDNRQAEQELTIQYRGIEQKAIGDLARLAEAEDWEAYDQVERDALRRLDENQKARRGILGGLTELGEEGEDLIFLNRLADLNVEVSATKSLLQLIRHGKDIVSNRDALDLIVAWRMGDDSNGEGRVNGMSYDDYVKFIPTQRGRDKAANWAAEQIQELDRLAREAEAAARDAEEDDRKARIRREIAALGSMALSNPEYYKIWSSDFAEEVLSKSPNIIAFMNSEENRNWAVAQVAHGGRLPESLKQYMIQNAAGTNAHLVVDVAEKMMGKRHAETGVYTGMQAWRELPETTRATIIRYRELADMEVPTEQRRAILNDIVTGKWRVRSAASAFKDDEGKPSQKLYIETRDRYIRAIFGSDPKKLPNRVAEEIESSVKSFLAVYGEDKDTAVRKAVESVATLWTPHPIGSNGYIPTELKGLNLTLNQLNDAFGFVKDGKIVTPGGSVFTNTTRSLNGVKLPRARITLTDDSQLPEGVGNYRVDFYDENGNFVGNWDNINIDAVLMRYFGSREAYVKRVNEARRRQAKDAKQLFQEGMKRASDAIARQPPRRGRDY